MASSILSGDPVKIDAVNPTILLVQLCVKVLRAQSPTGMTTRELAAALDNEIMEGFNGIASSILSSKLNAVFRRCHNDSSTPTDDQLRVLPITRAQSEELPRRLVYKYTPPSTEKGVEEVVEEEESDFEIESLKTENQDPLSPSQLTPVSSNDTEQRISKEDEPSSDEHPNEPLTPKEDNQSWSSAKRRRVRSTVNIGKSIHRSSTPPHYNDTLKENPDLKKIRQPIASPSSQQGYKSDLKPEGDKALNDRTTHNITRKAQAHSKAKFNIYYDVAGFDTVAAALDCESLTSQPKYPSFNSLNGDNWLDFEYPTNLGLSELDKMIS